MKRNDTMQTGEKLNVLGDEITLLAAGPQTGGTMTAIEVLARPDSGPPPHTHVYSELFYVLEGELEIELDGARRTVGAGDVAAVPGGSVHTYRNASALPVRFLAVLHPAGHERFLAEIGVPVDAPAPDGPPDVDHVMRVARRHGIEFVVPA
jgi:quercetin dioxygenase-like cupin family protein